jgi:hypothetical protein
MERLWRDYGEISNLAVMYFWEIAEHPHQADEPRS